MHRQAHPGLQNRSAAGLLKAGMIIATMPATTENRLPFFRVML